ncbi:unnamed protein product [Acanthoscelides obtectus]|uniref:Uncharacterized protein n=1 Tax=Acanthoscelides obtectus TaxID=200917 RepID=A0A9P0PZW9_ACAOB|nr:unnamed protein product [Acanthoscelides obtectus]CAK1656887.1 hypothetical protein AOBTE_LOCUS19997 [Acanthoscelides obtectus]
MKSCRCLRCSWPPIGSATSLTATALMDLSRSPLYLHIDIQAHKSTLIENAEKRQENCMEEILQSVKDKLDVEINPSSVESCFRLEMFNC